MYLTTSVLRVRETFNEVTGAFTTLSTPIVVCYTNFTFDIGLQTTDVPVSCSPGIQVAATGFKPELTIDFTVDTIEEEAMDNIFYPGRLISIEIIYNQFTDHTMTTITPAADQLIEVVRKMRVTARPHTQPGKGVGTRSVTCLGGVVFAQQLGRTGLPAPFNTAPTGSVPP